MGLARGDIFAFQDINGVKHTIYPSNIERLETSGGAVVNRYEGIACDSRVKEDLNNGVKKAPRTIWGGIKYIDEEGEERVAEYSKKHDLFDGRYDLRKGEKVHFSILEDQCNFWGVLVAGMVVSED